MARNPKYGYVTWQCHFDEDNELQVYWGHYTDSYDTALYDFNNRDKDMQLFIVEITETLQKQVPCKARNADEAVELVRSKYSNGEYVLDADNFIDVSFSADEANHNNILSEKMYMELWRGEKKGAL
jgi:hypothetical protein